MKPVVLVLMSSIFLPACDKASSPTRFEPAEFTTKAGTAQMAVLSAGDTLLVISAPKWKNGATAAVSINYDAPWGTQPEEHAWATDAVIERSMRMDLEVVTAIYLKARWRHLIPVYKSDLLPHGIRFFGHGHTHALHDTMEYDAAYHSFKTNFDLMQNWGLDPKVYAYPGSSGLRASTQAANRNAGFIAARGQGFGLDDWFIVPHDELEPPNWHYLPSVVMGNAVWRYIDVHQKLVPILDEAIAQRAWIILMYHSIGLPDGYSYYPVEDFRRDLDAMQERDFWSANMDAATCYVMERARLRFALQGVQTAEEEIILSIGIDDDLPDHIYNEPLTIEVATGADLLSFEGPMAAVSGFGLRAAMFEVVPDGATYTVRLSTVTGE